MWRAAASAGFTHVIDAIDSVRPKAALIAYCRRYKVPFSDWRRGRADQMIRRKSVSLIWRNHPDPLAAKLRERLKTYLA